MAFRKGKPFFRQKKQGNDTEVGAKYDDYQYAYPDEVFIKNKIRRQASTCLQAAKR